MCFQRLARVALGLLGLIAEDAFMYIGVGAVILIIVLLILFF